jgi:hypothetical protein
MCYLVDAPVSMETVGFYQLAHLNRLIRLSQQKANKKAEPFAVLALQNYYVNRDPKSTQSLNIDDFLPYKVENEDEPDNIFGHLSQEEVTELREALRSNKIRGKSSIILIKTLFNL